MIVLENDTSHEKNERAIVSELILKVNGMACYILTECKFYLMVVKYFEFTTKVPFLEFPQFSLLYLLL